MAPNKSLMSAGFHLAPAVRRHRAGAAARGRHLPGGAVGDGVPADPWRRRPTSTRSANALSYAALALGLNIVVGMAGLLDLGYAAFFAIGAYFYGTLSSFPAAAGMVGVLGAVRLAWARGAHARPGGRGTWYTPPLSFWLAIPLSGAGGGAVRAFCSGAPDAAAAWRLPGHRDARLRGDRPRSWRATGNSVTNGGVPG